MSKYIIGIIAVLAIAGSYYVGFMYPTASVSVGSPVGTTFNTAKVAQVNMVPSTSAATTSSIYNGSGNGYWIYTPYANCSNVNQTASTSLAHLTVTVATSSVANEGIEGNANTATVNVSTSTYFSANTGSAPSAVSAYWASGSYLTFAFNATISAQCTVGVYYQGS